MTGPETMTGETMTGETMTGETMTGEYTMTGEQTMTGEYTMTGRTLVAGVGNVFQRDDAFGVELASALEDGGTVGFDVLAEMNELAGVFDEGGQDGFAHRWGKFDARVFCGFV